MDIDMLLTEVVDTSRAVAGTRSRLAKRALLAGLLARTTAADVAVVASYLAGDLRQRRTGIGWASLRVLPEPSLTPTLDVVEVDSCLASVAELAGPGSTDVRRVAITELLLRATADEQRFLVGLITGNLRQGALDALLLEAVAAAFELDLSTVRRAAMLGGSSAEVAAAARRGGVDELSRFRLEVGRPVRPMLAGSAATATEAMGSVSGAAAVIDAKLDGVRVQAHRSGRIVRLFSRSLDDVTERMPEVVAQVLALTSDDLVLDGEALLVDPDGRPRPFQETAASSSALTACFFDLLRCDGVDLIDRALQERLTELARLVPVGARVPHLVTTDPEEAQRFFLDLVDRGFEGVVVKDPDSPYVAGRRGAGWIKVKPRHTLDLVVLAVEWGSGRRTGLLSNIHLGARTDDGDFVALGKTFKGMTDEMLVWQTERFLELEVSRAGHVVHVRPEQVVEIAFDGVQRSTRYPGGVVLRFARVLRYRDDKTAAEADLLSSVRAHLPS